MAVEEFHRQALHVLEERFPHPEHGALADGNHDAVVGIGADGAYEEYGGEFDEGQGEWREVGVADALERHDVVIDECPCEEG